MPWWIWLVLAVAALASLLSGGVIAFMHGLRALRTIGAVGGSVGERLESMSGSTDSPNEYSEPAVFTKPLRIAARRYADAHADVVERRRRRRNRHARQWAAWSTDSPRR